jgi:uncharacterized protein
VRVRDLQRHPGSRQEAHGELDLAGLRVGSAEVGGAPVVVTVALESIRGGIRVEGAARMAWQGECRRCLGEASGEVAAEVSELFADAPGTLEEPDGDEVQLVRDGWIDLGPAVRDAVVLSLPLAPLCREDCPGPSPGEFPVAVEGESDSEESEPDPRWAALKELRFDRPPG